MQSPRFQVGDPRFFCTPWMFSQEESRESAEQSAQAFKKAKLEARCSGVDVFHMVGWTKSSTLKPWLKPFLVGICRGIIIPGFLGGAKWISSIRSSVPSQNGQQRHLETMPERKAAEANLHNHRSLGDPCMEIQGLHQVETTVETIICWYLQGNHARNS